MQNDSEPVRIYVGTDRSQLLAVKVLEHSIRRHTKLPVIVTPLLDLPIRKPKDPRQGQRTGFSFSRYCIPKLAGYRGRAIYMDADMLVFRNIDELWSIPMGDSKIAIQNDLTEEESVNQKRVGAGKKRIKQSAVMLLNCDRLDWNIDKIIDDLDCGTYDYARLMYDICLVSEKEISYSIPFQWNSLETLRADTALLHYTDMHTQPWVSPFNKNAAPWLLEVRQMLATNRLSWAEIDLEIKLGYFRPSLKLELLFGHRLPRPFKPFLNYFSYLIDKLFGFKKHAEVNRIKAQRDHAISDFLAEKKL